MEKEERLDEETTENKSLDRVKKKLDFFEINQAIPRSAPLCRGRD
ncbi:MAG: hypothetical protein VXY11_00080 [Candidatus Thermoplasmatota archaeon]|nr:hypothetical protein [Candidatus Thermoplasmatota archaeon]